MHAGRCHLRPSKNAHCESESSQIHWIPVTLACNWSLAKRCNLFQSLEGRMSTGEKNVSGISIKAVFDKSLKAQVQFRWGIVQWTCFNLSWPSRRQRRWHSRQVRKGSLRLQSAWAWVACINAQIDNDARICDPHGQQVHQDRCLTCKVHTFWLCPSAVQIKIGEARVVTQTCRGFLCFDDTPMERKTIALRPFQWKRPRARSVIIIWARRLEYTLWWKQHSYLRLWLELAGTGMEIDET